MSCITVSEYFPHFKEKVTLKVIIMNLSVKWIEFDGVVKGLHLSKSPGVILQHVDPWGKAKFKDICKDNNYSVEFFNDILQENFAPDKDFVNYHGVYQLMMGKTLSPANSIKNWLMKSVLNPMYPQLTNDTSDKDIKQEGNHASICCPSNHHSMMANGESEIASTPEPCAPHKCSNKLPDTYHAKCSWHFELKIPYECDTNLIICDKHGTKFRLSRL